MRATRDGRPWWDKRRRDSRTNEPLIRDDLRALHGDERHFREPNRIDEALKEIGFSDKLAGRGRDLLHALIIQLPANGVSTVHAGSAGGGREYPAPRPGGIRCELRSQPVVVGRRATFSLTFDSEGRSPLRFVVECDEWSTCFSSHSQVAEDRRVDRERIAEGYLPLRFVPSDFDRGAAGIALEILGAVRKLFGRAQ